MASKFSAEDIDQLATSLKPHIKVHIHEAFAEHSNMLYLKLGAYGAITAGISAMVVMWIGR